MEGIHHDTVVYMMTQRWLVIQFGEHCTNNNYYGVSYNIIG